MSRMLVSGRFSTASSGNTQLVFLIFGGAGLLTAASLLVWRNLIRSVFASNYLPHQYCYLQRPALIWTHVASDSLIGISYFAISCMLAYLIYRTRRDLPFHWMFVAFGLFIVACGSTHIMEVVTVWIPVYVFSGGVKVFTAIASMATAIALPYTVPKALGLVDEAKRSRQYQVELQTAHRELRDAHDGLEDKIRDRTTQLADAVSKLEAEIAERSQLEAKLANLASIVEFSDDAIISKGLDGTVTTWNKGAERLYGYRTEEMVGQNISLLVPERDEDDTFEILSKITRGERVEHYETVRARKDGQLLQVSLTVSPIFDSLGKVIGASAIGRDITEKKRAEHAIRSSEAQYKLFFDSSPLPMWVFDRKTLAFIAVNQAAIKHYGFSREEFLSMTLLDIRPEEDIAAVREAVDRRDKGLQVAAVWRHRKKDGAIIDVEITTHDIDIGGNDAVLVLAHDVTNAKSLEEQLRQAQKMEAIGRLAGGIAHDFNNILAVITGYSDISEEQLEPGHRVARNIAQIKSAAERAAKLTSQLLAFSRQQLLQPTVLNLNEVVNNIREMLSRMLGEDVSLVFSLAPKIHNVKADRSQIEQILMNLIVNARDAMPDGGELTIETADVEIDEAYAQGHITVQPGAYVMLAVTDTGVGMDEKTIPRIFDPFFTTKEPGKGTGLGLATVYGIVKQSGGNIWVYSEPGVGTTFKVYLPQSLTAAETRGPATLVERPAKGFETILLVEDDDLIRQLILNFLQSSGYKVLEARNGRHAFELAGEYEGNIHLLLTDVVMPGGVSGNELAQRLRASRTALKVLFMSGYTHNHTSVVSVRDGDTANLQKPFTKQALLAKVRSILDN